MPTVIRPHPQVWQAARTLPAASRAPASLSPARLRRSRALASLLPAFVLSGAITCMMAAIMVAIGEPQHDVVAAWLESWLVSWPFAFPMTYLLAPVVTRLSAPPAKQPGLGVADVMQASRRVTRKHGLTALRLVKSDNHAT
ncbi:DUF2798 domain-containing protein [Noviherbaspirillum galbum]|uniref:DUF2798 domain-containing protein n=1 Tax=Noviherbaspirillum galbum TaxID=2709383 RepID=A0A6B3SS19_9BURK|nr:DUF2798 domain-containing protein [Noviherbaspirillum galbum]NEX63553.1 DUF2798 domain-containing protein [Noviherbaspirillum galbum]